MLRLVAPLLLIATAGLFGSPAQAQTSVSCTPFRGFPLSLSLGKPPLGVGGETVLCTNQKLADAINAAVNNVNNAKGKPNGFAMLDASGLLPLSQIPVLGALNATAAGRRAVEQSDASGLGVPTIGSASSTLADLFGNAGRSSLFGIKCDGANGTDNTAAINAMTAALTDAELPAGVCRYTNQILVPPGHTLRGQGETATTLYASPDFAPTAQGAIRLGGKGSRLLNIGMDFQQPDTGLRNQLNLYPTAINALSSGGGWTIDGVQVAHAIKTLDMRGEQGQSRIGTLKTSFFNMGIDLDGSTDSVNIGTLRFWTYGFTANQYQILFDGDTSINNGQGLIGLNTGRMDGLIVDSLFSIFYPKAIRAYYSSGYNNDANRAGITTATINKMQLDTSGGLVCELCDFSIASAYMNIGYSGYGYSAIIQHGGSLNIGQLGLTQFNTPGNNNHPIPATEGPLISVDNISSPAKFTISGMAVDQGSFDRTLLQVQNTNGAFANPTINIAALTINKTPGPVYTRDVLYLPGASGSLVGLSINPITSGSGTLIDAPNDNPLTILTSPTQGWINQLATNAAQLNVNYGFGPAGLTLPVGQIYAGGNMTAGGSLVGVGGLSVGPLGSPLQVLNQSGDAKVTKFGANGAAPVGKCTLPPAATDAASAQALANTLRTCLTIIGLGQ